MVKSKRPMTDEEIRTEHRQAKNQQDQIRILADQNLCSENEIREVLSLPMIPPKKRSGPKKEPSENMEKSTVQTPPVDMQRINAVLALSREEDDDRVRNDIQNLAVSLFWQELRRKGENP